MATPFIGEIRMVGANFAPVGWSFCNGALIPISQNSTLYNLIGTTYGGNGQTTFALPNLQGRVPVHHGADPNGNTYVIGQYSGAESVALTGSQVGAHNHPVMASSSTATHSVPEAHCVPGVAHSNIYAAPAHLTTMSERTSSTPGAQPHANIMPFQCISYIISLFGVYPSQN